ncbi:MAG: MarR family EPS-associated transcriptional regulator [Nitrosospira sp.]|nr:MarR family EPS-associated transcriptional regulator [Nitrosospira sp.]
MSERTLDNETRFRLLRRLADDPALSQRELAGELGVSLGKVNYCLKALLDKGYIKAENFRNSQNKRAYLYQLTPAGIAAKTRATTRFLARKQAEYQRLAGEIGQLQREMEQSNVGIHSR